MAPFIVRLITSPNINRFSKFFHCRNQETIYNETVTTDPTTSQVCRYTTSWNVRHSSRRRHWPVAWSTLIEPGIVAPKQPRLKSSSLCCSAWPSTDGLSMLTFHDSQPAKESYCRWVGQSAAAFGWSRHWQCLNCEKLAGAVKLYDGRTVGDRTKSWCKWYVYSI